MWWWPALTLKFQSYVAMHQILASSDVYFYHVHMEASFGGLRKIDPLSRRYQLLDHVTIPMTVTLEDPAF